MTRKERAELSALQRKVDLEGVLSTPAGRRVVGRLIEESGTFGVSFTGQPETSAFNEGRRSVGVALMAEMQRVAPDTFVLMLSEGLEGRKQDEQMRALDVAEEPED